MNQGTAHHARAHHSHLLHWLVSLGGMGLFVVSAIDASIIPLPVPGSTDLLLLLLVVHRANVWWMAIAAILGSIAGGYSTWSTGRKGGKTALERHVPKRYSKRLTRWVEKRGILAVSTAALLPPPVPLMPFLLAAGALGVSRRKFLVAFTAARTARYGLVAWLGYTYGRRMIRAWHRYLSGWSDIILWIFLAMVVAGILFGIWKFRTMQRAQSGAQTASLATERS